MWSSYVHKNEEAICSMFTRSRQYTHGECLATCTCGRVSASRKKRDKTTKQTHVKLDEFCGWVNSILFFWAPRLPVQISVRFKSCKRLFRSQLTQTSNPNLNPRLDRELWVLRWGRLPEANGSFQALNHPHHFNLVHVCYYIMAHKYLRKNKEPPRDIRRVWWDNWYPLNTDLDTHIIFYNGHLVLSYNTANRNMTNILCFSLVEKSYIGKHESCS
jgi:hypothetical protein